MQEEDRVRLETERLDQQRDEKKATLDQTRERLAVVQESLRKLSEEEKSLLGHGLFKVVHLTTRFGYHDKLSVPDALALARKQGLLERNLDLEHASYFVSRITITPTDAPGMRPWRKSLFIAMARNATSAIEHFGLPSDRTVIMGSQVAL